MTTTVDTYKGRGQRGKERAPHGRFCTTAGCKNKRATWLSGNSQSLARRIPLCDACATKARRVSESFGFRVHLQRVP